MITPRPSFTNPHALRMLRDRAWRAFLDRCGYAFGFLLTVSTFALILVLSLVTCAPAKGAEEIPSWVIRGIAAVETGVRWRDLGDIHGTWTKGAIGECGPWQLSPAVLRDLQVYDKRSRIHADPVFAESLTRAWLLRLHARTGSWPDAVAAFHAGVGRRREPFAIDYANRVQAVGSP